jgi:NADPH-dependent 2,4-dienoyl-CoA reductase/sulfur reductase-like enzyme
MARPREVSKMKKQYDVIVIGGGPAGLASAIAARNNGAESVLIIERDKELGGILNQCIHNGFGLHHFKEELSGPEYAGRFIDEVNGTDIDILLDTMVIEITEDKQVFCTSESHGYMVLQGKALILNMGCRERTRGAIAIPGDRPAGVFTAGAAQRYVNIEGYMVGKRVVILGSGDIGLIMARRMSLEGAEVLACVELMPYSNGLNRNIVQCLNDYNIPLYLSHTITDIKGKKRVEQVIVSKVDENRQIIPGTEMVFDCDCVLLSVGLIPENELTRNAGIQMDPRTNGPVVYENMETSVAGIFASGNVLHVHDLVDFVTDESEKAGKAAGIYVKHGESTVNNVIETKQGEGVGYTVPQKIRKDEVDKGVELSFRVRNNYHDAAIVIKDGDTQIARFKREHMAPAEMEKVMIPKVLLDKVNGNSLTISIEKEGD